ncbi:hypothetical protein JM658_06345 [Joostella atrarenae]|uniref:Lipoprotein n=1 Tax=Joostella atrarenae TaxID=679257 RepID=A0ABS9J270_9FLAO|nr:hypothetical protein [Joostella atrarenae]MCF8714448.1 hypothetical protein [Joostella atrarenae]
MRLYQFLFTLLIFSILSSCSSNEAISEELLSEIDSENYFPLKTSENWTYNIEGLTKGRDSVWVEKDTLIEGNIHYKTRANNPNLGFFTNLVADGLLHKSKSKLILNGTISNVIPELAIPVEGLVLLDMKDPAGNVSYQTSGMTSFSNQDYIIEIAYIITSKTEDIIEDYNLNGTDYENIIKTSVTVNIAAIANTKIDGYEASIPILNPHDVITSNIYFAPGIGVINNETNTNYKLTNLDELNMEISIDKQVSEVVAQRISNYSK